MAEAELCSENILGVGKHSVNIRPLLENGNAYSDMLIQLFVPGTHNPLEPLGVNQTPSRRSHLPPSTHTVVDFENNQIQSELEPSASAIIQELSAMMRLPAKRQNLS